jgi:serine protease AprX
VSRAPRRTVLSALSALTAAAAAAALAVTSLPASAAASAPLVRVERTAPLSASMAEAVAALPESAPFAAYVHFDGGDAAGRAALLTDHGLQVAADYASVDVAYAVGTLGALLDLRGEQGVTYLEADRQLQYFGDTGSWATRARVARTAVAGGPYRDASGRVLDGSGVGVAVVDSGVDGYHPDLANRLAKAFKVVCTTPPLGNVRTEACFGPSALVDSTDAPFTDHTGGHGTHVTGIALGDGTASNGTYQGVAPGATLYSYGVGEVIFVSDAVTALDHIITNYDSFTPRIKVVNNSYGDTAGTPYDPNGVLSKLTSELVGMGVTMVFAAGNGDANGDGGTGADDRLSSSAKDPTPGVITAANYDDGGTATRKGTLDSSSSRGLKGDPANYPDLSAPGSFITSTCNPALPICRLEVVPTTTWAPRYATISGTSMASPHVAGAVALLLQARPELTPAQVEDVLLDTAHKFAGDATASGPYEADPQNPGGTTSFDKGAGLLDVPAALDALGVPGDGKVATRTPTISLTSPATGTVNDGTAPLTVTGTAFDGTPAPVAPTTQVLASGDEDLPAPAPGAVDLRSLSVLEEPTGLRFTVGVRDVEDLGPLVPSFRLTQNVAGRSVQTSVTMAVAGPTAGAYNATTNNVVATDLTRDVAKDTVSFLLPFVDPVPAAPDAGLGQIAAGEIGSSVRVLAFIGSAVDSLPGGIGQAGSTNPEFGAPYLVRRPGSTPAPTATATLSVDGGPQQPLALTGRSPDYAFSTSVPTTSLADGAHTLTTRLFVGGVLKATDTETFTVTRPRVVTSSAAFTSPAEGATVPRAVVDVTGTATSDADAAVARTVTLQVTGSGYDSGAVTALGTTSWSSPVDFGALPAGSYLLTARLLLDGVQAAVATRTVVVPAPAVLVSCAPQALRFWQDQYAGGSKATLTQAERDALAAKAAELSSGWFADRTSVVTALYVKGKVPAQQAAAQQYAVLLLDLAGGQLSAGYSRQVGLSGAERLDPATYDTARLGTTVGSAAAWVRAQLPSGDHAGAERVAGSISRGTGLAC